MLIFTLIYISGLIMVFVIGFAFNRFNISKKHTLTLEDMFIFCLASWAGVIAILLFGAVKAVKYLLKKYDVYNTLKSKYENTEEQK